jgi:hypothetical protein
MRIPPNAGPAADAAKISSRSTLATLASMSGALLLRYMSNSIFPMAPVKPNRAIARAMKRSGQKDPETASMESPKAHMTS